MNFHTTESVVNLYPNTHEFYILKDCVCIFMTDKITKALARSVQHELQYSSHLCGPTTCFSHSRQLVRISEYSPYNEHSTNKRFRRVSVSTSAPRICAEEISVEVHTSHWWELSEQMLPGQTAPSAGQPGHAGPVWHGAASAVELPVFHC